MYEELKRAGTFSEKEYLSLDQLKERFSMADVSQTWDRVQAYRSLFRYDLPIRNSEKYPYFLTLNNNLLSRVSYVEQEFYRLCARIATLSSYHRDRLVRESRKEALRWVDDHYGIGLSDLDINSILDRDEKSDDPKTRILENYVGLLKGIPSLHGLSLGNIMSHCNDSFLDNPSTSPIQYRTIDEDGKKFQCGKDSIRSELSDLLDFLEGDERISFILKLICFIYQYTYIEPCTYFSLDTGNMMARAYLSSLVFDGSGDWILIEPLMYGMSDRLKNVALLTLETSDMTYFAFDCIDLINRSLESLERRVASFEEIERKDDSGRKEQEEKNFIGKEKFDSMRPDSSRYGDEDVYHIEPTGITMSSVPSYTSGKYPKEREGEMTDLDVQIQSLIEKHPVMKKHVAHFYLTHKTIGSFYTIGQYQSIEGVAYETARTSMDLLVNLGFYRKSKTAKKFIYTPIPRNGGNL